MRVATASGVVGGYERADGSWQGLFSDDPDRSPETVEWRSEDGSLGACVRAAIMASRFNIPQPAAWANGIDSDKAEQDIQLARAFGLSDAKRLYNGLRYCIGKLERGLIRIIPTRRRRRDFFPFDPVSQAGRADAVVPADAADADLGAAVRLAFSRCA